MRYVLMCAVAALFIGTAKADETLKFRVVQYIAAMQSQQVGDVNGHIQGFQRAPGIASFPDGSAARTLVLNAFDGTTSSGGGGTVNGYENIIFSDGSELWWKYSGTYKITNITENASHITAGGTLAVTGGKGRYAGAKGDGTYTGTQDRTGSFTQNETLGVNDFVLNIKK